MEHYDIIVAGGGPAGVAAAIAAARNKCKVLLVEKEGYLGGMATGASIPAFCPFTDGEKVIIGGIGIEILKQLKKISYDSPFYDEKPDRIRGIDWVPIDAEALKLVLDEMVIKSGCNLLLHTVVIETECVNNRVSSITIVNKGGIKKITGDIFIDCTGDADLLAMSGGEYEYGDENGMVQAGTLCFRIANFDTDRFMVYAKKEGETGNLKVASAKAKADGKFPVKGDKVAGFSLIAKGVAAVNFGHVYNINPLCGKDLTRAEIEARERIPELLNFLRNYVPGAENAVVAISGPNIGIRESRRIVGEYRLSESDYMNRADFEDAVAYYSYPIDMHASKADEVNTKENRYQTSKYKNGESYGIPYRSLLPKGVENMLVAGRSISCDRSMMASVRVMPACFATGQAAGSAAALSILKQQDLRRINIADLKKLLREQGAYLR